MMEINDTHYQNSITPGGQMDKAMGRTNSPGWGRRDCVVETINTFMAFRLGKNTTMSSTVIEMYDLL